MMGELIKGQIEGRKTAKEGTFCENGLNSKPYKQMGKQTD